MNMHKIASFNGNLIDADDARIGALSSAALYGRGVFTTIAIHDSEPFLMDKHLRRLRNDSDAIGLRCGENQFNEIEQLLAGLIKENSVSDGRARIAMFDASLSRMWSDDSREKVDTLVITADQRNVPVRLNLTVSPYAVNSTSPLAGVKSCNYLENILAINETRSRGFDEGIRLNERGEVTSACMANVFWTKGDELFTPCLATGCLAGTTREFVLENFDCREVNSGIDEVLDADSIFITSAGIGIRPVKKLDEQEFADSAHPLLDLLPSADKKTRMSAN